MNLELFQIKENNPERKARKGGARYMLSQKPGVKR